MLTARRPWTDLAVVGVAVLVFWLPPGRGVGWPSWCEPALVAVLVVAGLVGSRRPWLATGLAMAATGVGLVGGLTGEPMVVAAWCLARARAASGRGRLGRALPVILLGILFLAVVGVPDTGRFQIVATSLVVLAGGWALGTAVAAERAEAARAARAEAARTADVERLRLVQDVHDVVSHSVATITLTAGVGAHVTPDDPIALRRKLAAIEDLGRSASGELRRVLTGVPPAERGGGRAAVATLVEPVRAAGIPVELEDRAGPPLPAAVDELCHRIIREALTNVVRHAPGSSCRVELARRADELIVTVSNTVSNAAGSRPGEQGAGLGLGLAGLRASVRSMGGHLDAGPAATGGYRLTATLPVGAA